MNWKLVASHQIYLHTKNWVDRVQDGRLAAIFVCEKWHYLPIFQVSSFSVHNLHTQWIEKLWQIMKSIRVQHFSHINFSIWPPGGSDMSKNWGKIIISLFLFIIYIHNELQSCSKSGNVSGYYINIDFYIWPPGGSGMSKNWKKS